jgi:DNA repair exonuclease SbcCD ATPase subunit
MEIDMKKIFYSTFFLVGLFACYQVEAIMMQALEFVRKPQGNLTQLQNDLKQAQAEEEKANQEVNAAVQEALKKLIPMELQEKLKTAQGKVATLESQLSKLQQETQKYNTYQKEMKRRQEQEKWYESHPFAPRPE